MSNEIYLYGLSRDGGGSIELGAWGMQSMSALQAEKRGDEDGVVWVRICSLPEALAAPKMREALERIAGLKEKEFEFPADWQDQINACPECQGWAKNHPIQNGICNTHRQPLYAREKHDKRQEVMIGYDAKSIAREALAACGPGCAPTPDPRDEKIKRLREVLDCLTGVLAPSKFVKMARATGYEPMHYVAAHKLAVATLRGEA